MCYRSLTAWLSGDTDYEPERTKEADLIELFYYYPKLDKNVFTKENLKAMKEVEDKFMDVKDFRTKFCLLENGVCMKPTSILRFFDGTYKDVDSIFDDPNFNDIVNVINKANFYNETKLKLSYHLSKQFEITPTKVFCYATRSYIQVGYPLQGFNSSNDRASEQEDELKKFYRLSLVPVGDEYYSSGVNDMDFLYNSGVLIGLSILTQVSYCFIYHFHC